MKILVVGGGGREHAIIRALKENPEVEEIYALPGNGGIAADATCVSISATDIDGIVAFAQATAIDYAVVAPDDPLVLGCVDRLEAVGVPCFGPNAKAAIIEGSKAFSKNLMKKYGIPTAAYAVFTDLQQAQEYLQNAPIPTVIKADGLALGKGVIIAQTREEALQAVTDMMANAKFGKSGSTVVIEEFLTGPEVSVLAFTDGKTIKPMVSSMDHKRAGDGDTGLNTGGMGKDYFGIEVEKDVASVTDEEIDREIETVRERNSREIDVTDRAAEMGDTTVIDFEGFCDGVAFEGGKGTDYALKLGSGSFIPGFEEQIVGKSIDEEFDVNVTFPEEYHAKELAGKPAVFKVKIHAITRVELPALDDDFAKDVSEFDTFDEYKADLKAKIEKRHETAAENAVEDKLVEALIEKLEAEIPEAMYEAETENYVRDYDTRLRSQGLDLKTYFKYTGMDLDSLRQQMRPQAERQVKARLALEKIAALENVEATEEDINGEYQKIADAYGIELDQVKASIDSAAIAEDMKVKKALDLVKEKAVVAAKA